ncbi:MAG: proline iminopeptidase-family hydrolase [Actinomycetota bacterium]|nr:proline iminopeptidase-family hydrolase [Actinomycetota bacterium]
MSVDYQKYFERTGAKGVMSGGINVLPVATPLGEFAVWTKRTGNNPDVALLLLHGGPGATHEYFTCADSYLPAAGVEYHYYDQLGSGYSSAPDEPSLWTIERFVDEVEQVRQGLGLGRENFFLLGHSWGGVLAIEYALKYQQHLKGVIISNMMSNIAAYNDYAQNVLMPPMDPAALAEIKAFEANNQTQDPRYDELLMEQHYVHHVLRLPADQWPEPVVRSFSRINKDIYVPLQGPSELGASGLLLEWDRTGDLHDITVPTLVIGAEYDTMDPGYLRLMASQLGAGEYWHCPNGSHMAMYDDQETYFDGLISFLRRHA